MQLQGKRHDSDTSIHSEAVPASLKVDHDAAALAGFAFELLHQDGVLATLRGRHATQASAILIVTAASAEVADAAAPYLNNEYALRAYLRPEWALLPHTSVALNGAMALVYDAAGVGTAALSQRPAGALEVGAFLRLAVSISHAVRQMHEAGVLHQNLKPANMLMDAAGCCRLTGFGVARLSAAHVRPLGAGLVRGTPAYMAPEQSGRTQMAVDVRSDLYAVGVSFYELLTGRLPFLSSHPASANAWIHAHLASEPVPPHRDMPGLPPPLSQLLLKLLAKNQDERYQNAASLEADVRRCQQEWLSHALITPFPLGQDGMPVVHRVTRLHGRQVPMAALLAEFARVTEHGIAALVVVHGVSGVGKSALVAHFLQHPQLQGAAVATAKVDQFAGTAPYVALADAMRSLVAQIRKQGGQDAEFWRERLQRGLAGDAGQAFELVPELALLIDPCDCVEATPVAEAPGHLTLTVLRLLQLFAVPERPLVLSIDDVQWLDAASLQLLDSLLEMTRALPLLLLLTCRSEPQQAALPTALAQLQRRAAHASVLALTPLDTTALADLLAEAMRTERANVTTLAQLVYQKTAGNPYFVQQFMQTIADQGLIVRDRAGVWQMHLADIGSRHYTANVADLLLARLTRLSASTQRVLGGLSCLGRSGSTGMLCTLYAMSGQQMEEALTAAIEADVLAVTPYGYVFTHDRLQEAAYAALPPLARQQLHVQLGQMMAQAARQSERDDILFGAMEHFKNGADVLTGELALQVVELALLAARKSRRSCAHGSALSYLQMARKLLTQRSDAVAQQLTLELDCERAHGEFFSGNLDAAASLIPQLQHAVQARLMRAQLARLAVDIAVRRGDYGKAVAIALEALRGFGIDMAAVPSDADCEQAYAALCQQLQGHWRAQLHDLPQQSDADLAAVMSLLSSLLPAASFHSPRLLFLQLCRTLQLSLVHGMCGEASVALAWLGVMVCERYGDYAKGFEFGIAARALLEQHGYRAYAAQILLALDQLAVWTQPLAFSLDCAQAGFDAALAVGDLTMACFESCHRTCMLLVRGDRLDTVAAEISRARAFVARADFKDVEAILLVQQQFVDYLRGLPEALPLSSSASDASGMATLQFWHWLYLAMAQFLDGDLLRAHASLEQAGALAWSAPAHIHLLEYHLLRVLTLCAIPIAAAQEAAQRARIAAHAAPLAAWAEANPSTFADKHALAQAAILQRAGEVVGALRFYEQAIEHAERHGFYHYAAMANEMAAALCQRGGHGSGARAHWQAAIDGYRRWGALRKVAQLQAQMPLRRPLPGNLSQDTVSIVETAEIRNLDCVIRAMRALSEEIQAAPLVRSLMTIALEHSSAQRALLVRMDDVTLMLQARAVLTEQGTVVDLEQLPASELDVPLSMLFAVMRTQQVVIVEAGPRSAPFNADPYLLKQPRCHAICIPMLKQARMVGMLYLENRLVADAFTGEQVKVLSLLAAQAAVSLETASLYAALQEENRQRRQAEQVARESRATLLLAEQINRSGSWVRDQEAGTLSCSPEFCRLFGFDPAQAQVTLDAVLQRIHSDDRARVMAAIEGSAANRHAIQIEYRIIDDAGKVHYLAGAGEPLGTVGKLMYVGTTIDITARREAENALHRAHAELARVARVTTVGQLTSSIAHEVNQPLMSISSHAGASLRWLDRDPPQLDRVRSGLQEIADQSQRAGAIIGALRALTSKGEQVLAPLDLHATIRHIAALSRSELERHDVALELVLHAVSGWINGDAVQLQQVLLNVVVNAIEAMSDVTGRERRLRIATDTEQNQIVVRVDDSGGGIDCVGAARMFEPYFTTKNDGMGMGLAICSAIIAAHGGSIRAEPHQPHGCSVLFGLPELPT